MGLRLKDANEEQKAFLNEIAHDPSKGQKWVALMGIVTDCMADIQEAKKGINKDVDPILLRFLIRAFAMKMVAATDDAFPFERTNDVDINPVAPALRLDTVKYFHLGGLALGSNWNENKMTMEKD